MKRGITRALAPLAAALCLLGTAAPAHAADNDGVVYFHRYFSRTGLALDTNFDGAVYTLPANGGYYQNWIVAVHDDGSLRIWNQATSRCLDSNWAGAAYTLPCNDGAFQRWNVAYTGDTTRVFTNQATGYQLVGDPNGSVYMTSGQTVYAVWVSASV